MKNKEILLSLALLIALNAGHLSAGEIRLIRIFETWNAGIINSTDPAGIVYHPPSGHLFIVDSEINEIAAIWNCENIFEIDLSGNQVFNTFDSYAPGGRPCSPLFDIFRREPTGITYNEFDGFFYVTNDDRHLIMRYDAGFGEATAAVVAANEDVEGITSDPSTGYLYVVVGREVSKVLVFTSDLDSLTAFSVNDRVADPEGIAYNPQLNHLFLVSEPDLKIFEYTLKGEFVTDYDISGLLPTPIGPQGLTFAPSSDPNDHPGNFNLYIADGQIDNNQDAEERDGIIYEIEIMKEIGHIAILQNYPNPFNHETQIPFKLPEATHVVMKIYNVRGREIRRLLDRAYPAGNHVIRWDGKDNHGNQVSSGVYFYQLQGGIFFQVKKMSLLK